MSATRRLPELGSIETGPGPAQRLLLRAATALLLASALGLFVFHARIYWQWTEDDAFITYRYAANVERGAGFVFNQGEFIEGYSNFSWVLLSAAALRAGKDPVQVAKGVGLAAGAVAVLLAWILAWRIWPQIGLGALLAPYTLAISPVLVQHAVAGLETSVFAALLTGALLLAAPGVGAGRARGAGLGVLLVLLTLTRSEGAILAAALLVLRGLLGPRRGGSGDPALTVATAVFLVLGAAYTWWRYHTFQEILPNTFYAKARGGLHGIIDGAQYSLDFMRDNGGVLYTALALVPPLLGWAGAMYWMGLAVLVLYAAFVVVAGGDWMSHYRFYAHVFPVLAALVATGWMRLLALPRRGTVRAVAVYLTAAAVLLGTFLELGNTELRVARSVLPALAAHNYLSQNYEELGVWFKENTDPEASIAISDVGAVGYFSERHILDMFGLIDPHIARLRGRMHYKADPRYVLSRAPDYIVLVSLNDQGAGYSFQRIPDYAMNALPEFHEQYDHIRTFPLHWNSEFVLVYRRR